MTNGANPGRVRAYLEFVAAILFFFIVRSFARHAAAVFPNQTWAPLIDQTLFVFLLILGYAAFGALFARQSNSIAAQGLPLRAGWPREFATGIAVGWGAVVVAVLPMLLIGGIAIVLSTTSSSWLWVFADAAFFALLALGEEVTYRGYAFQRFEAVVGSTGAAFGFAVFYAVMRALLPGATNASIAISVVYSFLLTTAYLRTRALWISWGLNFAWKASQALIFGLTVAGVSSHSPVIEGNPMGPFWLTGGGFGLDASWFACLVLLFTFAAVYRVTRDLDFKYNPPRIVPAGIPVDLDAAARRQHEAAMAAAADPPSPPLVQILPTSTPPPHSRSASHSSTEPEESQ